MPSIPRALPANTEEDVRRMFDEGYYSRRDGKDICEVVDGTHCLWEDVPTGKQGGRSTKLECFHGYCHGWEHGECILSCDGIREYRIHPSYLVGDPRREYCVVAGGRCCRKAEVWALQRRGAWSNARSVAVNFKQSGPTRHITRRFIHSNVNVSLVVTCDVVVGLVFCKSNGGTRVDFLG